jgi:hypothetical protein
VEPLVSWSSAVSSSSAIPASAGCGSPPPSPSSRESIVRNGIERSASTGASASNGDPSSTSPASIMRRTVTVSSAHAARSVRGVGWCSIVTLPPTSHTAWAAGAIEAGSPASTPTAVPFPTAGAPSAPARRAAAIRVAVACTSGQVRRTGATGAPVVMP